MMQPGLRFPLSPLGLRLIAATVVVVNGFFPALWILFTSLKTEAELVAKPITWWPHAPTLRNYVQAFTDQPLLHYLGNSVLVALRVDDRVARWRCPRCAAYAIARLNLKRRRQLILTCIVASSHVPAGHACWCPYSRPCAAPNLLNTYTALILPYIGVEPAGVHPRAGELLPKPSPRTWRTPR